MHTCSNEQFTDRLRKRVKRLNAIAFNSNTDDESSSDSGSAAEYNYHSEQEFLDEEENGVSVQEAWDNTWYDSNDEGNQQVPNHSQERGRRVVPPPTKARSFRPKEPPPVRPLPISPYLEGNGNLQLGQRLWLGKPGPPSNAEGFGMYFYDTLNLW